MIGEIVLPTDSERANVGPPIVVLIDLWTFLRPRRPPGLWVPDFLFLGGTLRRGLLSCILFPNSLESYERDSDWGSGLVGTPVIFA